jgi:acetyltransferase-like isoleucine patch superfamily enzyme
MMLSRSSSAYIRLRLLRNRAILTCKRLGNVDPTSYVHPSTRISPDLVGAPYVFIGRDCEIGPKVEIGKYTMLAPRIAIVGDDHAWRSAGVPMQFAGRAEQQATLIGSDVWIGYGATIMRGVTIGHGSIVAAGAVVVADVPPYEVWGGVPARRLRDRFATAEERAEHEDMLQGSTLAPRFAERV